MWGRCCSPPCSRVPCSMLGLSGAEPLGGHFSGCFAVDPGRSRADLVPIWYRSVGGLGADSILHRSGSSRCRCGFDLVSMWVRSGFDSGSMLRRSWVNMGPIWYRSRVDSVSTKGRSLFDLGLDPIWGRSLVGVGGHPCAGVLCCTICVHGSLQSRSLGRSATGSASRPPPPPAPR